MSNDPEYVNKCLVTIYLLSQPNINLNLAKCGCHLSIVYLLCIVWVSVLGSRYSSKVILIMFLCRTCSDICNIHFTEQERPQFLWEVTLGETNTVAVIQRGETSRLEVEKNSKHNISLTLLFPGLVFVLFNLISPFLVIFNYKTKHWLSSSTRASHLHLFLIFFRSSQNKLNLHVFWIICEK